MRIYKTIIFFLLTEMFVFSAAAGTEEPGKIQMDFQADVRGYFINDQRIQWSGMEATFGSEAALTALLTKRSGKTEWFAGGEFRVNQPFDGNMMTDEYRRP